MTQWEEGDRFTITAEGVVTHPRVDYIGVDFHDGHPVPVNAGRAELSRAWFDEHATKIERPLEFGDAVRVEGTHLLFRVLVQFGDRVRVWPIGMAHVDEFDRSELTPVDLPDGAGRSIPAE